MDGFIDFLLESTTIWIHNGFTCICFSADIHQCGCGPRLEWNNNDFFLVIWEIAILADTRQPSTPNAFLAVHLFRVGSGNLPSSKWPYYFCFGALRELWISRIYLRQTGSSVLFFPIHLFPHCIATTTHDTSESLLFHSPRYIYAMTLRYLSVISWLFPVFS